MERIPEPELMDDPEQAEAYASADFSEPHNAFVAHFRRLFRDFVAGRVLDLGCGPADIGIRFCKAYPDAILTGVDASAAMLQRGYVAVREAGLAARLQLVQSHLPDESLAALQFDAIISNSLLHHLDDPAVLWETVKQTAKPGAPVLIMDLMRPSSFIEAGQLAGRYAGDASPVLRRDFHNSLLAAYRPEEVRAQLYTADLLGFRVEAVSDRHLLIWGNL
jgi:SAM-dependent methyltransferase